ncbi:hypothetical protein ACMXYV_08005 [Neptuniibacter sp. SY11_33]|uniref:hypothetical protein n=1 Tax=Neptuniibacter sp. SY11_33 TaxID=3398215 RepID=UPI0039F47C1E
MRIFKYLTLALVLALVSLTLFGIGKCKYESINDLITEGGGYGISIGDTFPQVIDSLKTTPENYPKSETYLHYYDYHNYKYYNSRSVTLSWDLVHKYDESKSLSIYYDPYTNYLDFLDIGFEYGKVDRIFRAKNCALNPEHNKFHRWVQDLLYWGADLLNIDLEL